MSTEELELEDDTYAYCPGECAAQVTKGLYDALSQEIDGSPLEVVCGDPEGVGCSHKGQPLVVR